MWPCWGCSLQGRSETIIQAGTLTPNPRPPCPCGPLTVFSYFSPKITANVHSPLTVVLFFTFRKIEHKLQESKYNTDVYSPVSIKQTAQKRPNDSVQPYKVSQLNWYNYITRYNSKVKRKHATAQMFWLKTNILSAFTQPFCWVGLAWRVRLVRVRILYVLQCCYISLAGKCIHLMHPHFSQCLLENYRLLIFCNKTDEYCSLCFFFYPCLLTEWRCQEETDTHWQCLSLSWLNSLDCVVFMTRVVLLDI